MSVEIREGEMKMNHEAFNILGVMVRLHQLAHNAMLVGDVQTVLSLRNGIDELEAIFQSLIN
jgi:hypothetical protein